jgi:uncharacterized repeat protein (TIGR03803 family)
MFTNSPRKPAHFFGVMIALALALPAPAASTETIIHNFTTHDGLAPAAPLVKDAAGNFYGTTQAGGTHNAGAVFEIAAGTGSESVVYSFKGGKDGSLPEGGLVMDIHGNLFGVTVIGGTSTCSFGPGCGIVFELSPTSHGWEETIIHRFKSGTGGGNPYSNLIFDSTGSLFGTTFNGGTYNQGTVFELTPSSGGWKETVLYSFTGGSDGTNPQTGLTIDADSNLFGTTTAGNGNVFELSPSSQGWRQKVIYKFTGGNDGGQPMSGVVLDARGNLFGTAHTGGTHSHGTVFELSPQGGNWQQNTLYSFTGGADGAFPLSNVVFDGTGNMYGTTFEGGDHSCDSGGVGGEGCGVVFMLGAKSGQETVLHTFSQRSDGANPIGGVTFDSAGNLYGTTELNGRGGFFGEGIVYKLAPQTNDIWVETVIHAFADSQDGWNSFAHLVTDAAGNLVGTTQRGGAYNAGTVFELTLTANGWKQKVIHSFRGGPDGAGPLAGLIFDSNGDLYGTTQYGGGAGQCHFDTGPVHCGAVFKLTHQSDGSWAETVLYGFKGASDGALPQAALVFDSQGNLFGTTINGGRKNSGTVFQLTPAGSGWTESVISNIGGHPVASLAVDSAGNLYGTTQGDGRKDQGKVFELMRTSGGWTEKVLHAFTGPDGSEPHAGVVFDAQGNLFGTTVGITQGFGSVFELTPTSNGNWQESVIYGFSGTADGAYPTGLILDGLGNIYGATQAGGKSSCNQGCGLVYQLSHGSGGWQQTVLHNFLGGADGEYPGDGVILGNDGSLYGTTPYGGANGLGIIYQVTP